MTGLFKGEANVVEYMKLISEVVKERGFHGELMYFGLGYYFQELSKGLY